MCEEKREILISHLLFESVKLNLTKRNKIQKRNSLLMNEEDDAQLYLNRKTVYDIRRKGGENVLHAMFLNYLIKEYSQTKEEQNFLLSIKKHDEFSNYIWDKSLRVCLALLKRNKMYNTINTIESEFGKLPRKTGFRNGKQLDCFFHEIIYERPKKSPKKHHKHHHHTPTKERNSSIISSQDKKTTKEGKNENEQENHFTKEQKVELEELQSFLITDSPIRTNEATIIDTITQTQTEDKQNTTSYVHVFHEMISSSGSKESGNSLSKPPKLSQEIPILNEDDLQELEGNDEEIQIIEPEPLKTTRRKKKVRIKKKSQRKTKTNKEAQQIPVLSSTFDSGDASLMNEDNMMLFDSDSEVRKSNEVTINTIETLSSIQEPNDESLHTFDALQNFIDDGEPSLSIDTGDGSPVFRRQTRPSKSSLHKK